MQYKPSIKQKILKDTNKIDASNNIENQLKILTNVKKYFLHTYIGHGKQPPIIKQMPKSLVLFIKTIENLETEINQLKESAER